MENFKKYNSNTNIGKLSYLIQNMENLYMQNYKIVETLDDVKSILGK